MAIRTGTEGSDSFYSDNSVDTILGLGGYDTWFGEYRNQAPGLTFTWDGLTGNGSMSNGTTLSSIESGYLALFGNPGARVTMIGNGNWEITGVDTLVVDSSGYTAGPGSAYAGPSSRNGSHYVGGAMGFQFAAIGNLDFTMTNQDDRVRYDLSSGGFEHSGAGSVRAVTLGGNDTVTLTGMQWDSVIDFDGGSGTDNLILEIAAHGPTTTFIAHEDGSVESNVGTYRGFEVFDLTLPSGPVTVRTLAGNDTLHLHGGGISDVDTGGGDDTIYTEFGEDTVNGGTGADTLILLGSQAYYTITQDAMGRHVLDYVRSDVGGNPIYLTNVEFIQFADARVELGAPSPGVDLTGTASADKLVGSAFTDTLRGLAGSDVLIGDAGFDHLEGGDGADRLLGGAGIDYMAGGSGNDLYWIDTPDDLVDEALNGGNDTVYAEFTGASAGLGFWLHDNIENVKVLAGVAYVIGNSLDNQITGAGSADGLSGGAGKDTIRGGGGNDGLRGDEGGDSLYGGSGNDRLAGGLGADYLDGGAGADTFRFDTLATSAERDILPTFEAGIDKFQIYRNAFPALQSEFSGPLAPGILKIGSAATTPDQHLVYNRASGNLYYDPDGSGPEAQIRIALMWNHPILTANDFLLV